MSKISLVSCAIDYASLNVAVDSSSTEKNIVDRLMTVSSEIAHLEGLPTHRIISSQAGYRYSIKLPLFTHLNYRHRNDEVPHLRISAEPYLKGKSFIRAELKGHPLSQRHRLCARLWLMCVFGADSKKYLLKSSIRLSIGDLAYDVDSDLSSIMLEMVKSQKSGAYWDNFGKLETIYNGNKSSKGYLCAYSRNAKFLSNGKNIPWKGARTRIEVRLKFRRYLSDKEFSEPLSKLLRRLTVYDLSKVKESEILMSWFLELSKTIGLKPLMNHFNSEDRRKIRRAIRPYIVESLPKSKLIALGQNSLEELSELAVDTRIEYGAEQAAFLEFIKEYVYAADLIQN